jgi:hypothetical protein
LHEQNDRNAKVRGCCAEDALFFIHGQHALRRPLPALVEMFHAGRRVLVEKEPGCRESDPETKRDR